jgi:Chaperone of endosialidase
MRMTASRSLIVAATALCFLATACSNSSSNTDASSHGGTGGGQAGGGGRGGSTGGGGQGGGNACIPVGQACSGSDRCCAPAVICAGTCMTGVSDRNLKRDFTPVNRDEILEALEGLPLSTWSYTTEESGARHIGPMAQDFMATFHVGSSDKLIYQVDADGVALAAIQALSRRVDRLTEENAGLQRDLARLRSEVARNRRSPTIPR